MTSLFFRALAHSGDLSPQNGPNCRGLERSSPVPPLLVSSRAFFVTMAPRLGAHNKPNSSEFSPFFLDPSMLAVLGRADTFHLCFVMSLDVIGRALISEEQMAHDFFVNSMQASLVKLTQLEKLVVSNGFEYLAPVSVPEVATRFEHLFKQLIPASRIASTLQELEIAWLNVQVPQCDSIIAPALAQLVNLSALKIPLITAAVLCALAAGPGRRLRRLHGTLCSTEQVPQRERAQAFASFVSSCSEVRCLLLKRPEDEADDANEAAHRDYDHQTRSQSILALALQLPYLQQLELEGDNMVDGGGDDKEALGRIISGGVASTCLKKIRIFETSGWYVLDHLAAAAIASVGRELVEFTVVSCNSIPRESLIALLDKNNYSKLTSFKVDITEDDSYMDYADDEDYYGDSGYDDDDDDYDDDDYEDDNSGTSARRSGKPLSLPPSLTHLDLSGLKFAPRQVAEFLTDLPHLNHLRMDSLRCSSSLQAAAAASSRSTTCKGDCWLDRLVQCPIRKLTLSSSFGAQQLSRHLAGNNRIKSQPFRESLTHVSLVELEKWQGGSDREDLVAAIVKYCINLRDLSVRCDDAVTVSAARMFPEFNCGSTLNTLSVWVASGDTSLKPLVDALLAMSGGGSLQFLMIRCKIPSFHRAVLVFSKQQMEMILAKFKNMRNIAHVDERCRAELQVDWPNVQFLPGSSDDG